MNSVTGLALMACGIGVIVSLQGVINARLTHFIGGPLQAALISFSVGLSVLFAANIAMGNSLPQRSVIATIPYWAWIGGALGAIAIGFAAFAIPKIGTGTYFAAIIAGQLIAAVLFDHFGMLGQDVRPITISRTVGLMFLLLGVFFIRQP